jgi:serine/threonine protein kinase/dipeptidyl aminopeptidase/acylaminoacyl peptidase
VTTPERWAQAKALFQAAIERPAAERDAFVAAAAGDDVMLRREVEALLSSDGVELAAVDGWSISPEDLIAVLRALPAFPAGEGSTAVTLAVGSRVGPYEILSPIGAGAMGEVYRAHDTKLNRDVAVKVLPRPLVLDPARVARFRREAQILASLNHPHIASIYGLEESDGVQALILELVDGPTLADRIVRGPLPIGDVLEIGRQIAEAVEAAHDKGIIHRDLKPGNIKIASNGAVKVLDFGLAKVWEGAADPQASSFPGVTLDGERLIVGTPAYMSPEQTRGKPVDKRTDIWSFGCVLFEMLTGKAPFGAETVSDTIARVLDGEVDWQALPASTPLRLRHLVHRCLQKDPHRRLRDIGDARLELEEGSATRNASGRESVRDEVFRNRHTRRWALPLGLVLATGAVAMIVSLSGRLRSAPPPTFRELTFRHGMINGARLAADGRTVVYSAKWMGAPAQVYIIRPEGPESGSIGLMNAGIYSVSSRGELAVALGCRLNWGECLGTLAQVPMAGGSPREIKKDVLVADWSRDGQKIAVVSADGDRYQLEYPIGTVLYQPAGWITFARISPAGDRIAFLDHPQLGDASGTVSVVDLTGRKTTLSSGWKHLQGLAWSSDGDEVWFTGSRSGRGGSSAMFAVTLSGRERMVFSSPGGLRLHDISPDGERVLLTRGTTRGSLSFAADGQTERDLSWFDFSTLADLSSDGRTLLFYEWGEGVGARPTAFVRRTDGSDPTRLGEGRPLALSPDGQWALAVRGDAAQQLVLLPIGAGEAKLLPRGNVAEFLDWAAWSPSGRQVIFAARELPDVRRTYIQDVDGGSPRPLTPDGYVGISLAPDGLTLAVIDRYGEYHLCGTDRVSDPRPLAGYRDGDVVLGWSADRRFVFVREAGNLALRIYKLDLASGARTFWKEIVPPDPAVLIDIGSDPGQVRITADGKAYAYTYWTFAGELYLAQGLK